MTYVEWLRVAVTLKRTAITLGVIVVLAIAGRLWLGANGPIDAGSYVSSVQRDPRSRVTATTLADGTRRTTIDNVALKVHAVVDDEGNGHQVLHIVRSKGALPHVYAIVGNVDQRTFERGSRVETTIDADTSGKYDSAAEVGIAGFVALIAGMILAGCFARENDGHLEIALTKPISRTALAVQMMLVDCAGIVAVWMMSVVAIAIVETLFVGPHFGVTANDGALALVVLLGAIAWYALLCCATASIRRNYGVILGTAWIVGQIIPVLARVSDLSPPVFLVLRAVARPLSWIDPFTYARIAIAPQAVADMAQALPYRVDIPILVVLALTYAAFATVQWRRVEA